MIFQRCYFPTGTDPAWDLSILRAFPSQLFTFFVNWPCVKHENILGSGFEPSLPI